MPHSFPNIGNATEFVGQTPWSARDALVPLSARRIKALHATMADEGVGRGRGRPPYNLRRCSAMGKLRGIDREGAIRSTYEFRHFFLVGQPIPAAAGFEPAPRAETSRRSTPPPPSRDSKRGIVHPDRRSDESAPRRRQAQTKAHSYPVRESASSGFRRLHAATEGASAGRSCAPMPLDRRT